MSEMLPTHDEVAGAIKEFREVLMNAGFRHANGAGELVNGDDTTWVGTQYAHKEYSIYVWRRPRGHGEIAEQRYVLRVRVGTHDPESDGPKPEQLFHVERLGRKLKRWANKTPTRDRWPLEGTELVR